MTTSQSEIIDRVLVFEDFADKVGSTFAINEAELPAILMTLKEAEPLNPASVPAGTRAPFSLIFLAGDPRVLPQSIYQLTHETLGRVSIFLVPIGQDAEGVSYQAVFN